MKTKGIPAGRTSQPGKRNSSSTAPPAARSSADADTPSRLPRRTSRADNDRPIFDPETVLARVGAGRKIVNVKEGQSVYVQGERADHIFFAQSGRMRVTVTSATGKVATIALLGAGDFLGEDCMTSAYPLRLATATAMTDSVLVSISKVRMVRALQQERELSSRFVSFLLARNARIQADLVDQLFNSSEKRLARILLLLAQFGKSSKPETLIPKISQETLAEMIGTTRSRVSFFMNRFRTMGFIEYNGGIRVHNSLLNIFLQE
jgi:CRP/FNR family transcriptional regulator, cyclic AMP receptor protein